MCCQEVGEGNPAGIIEKPIFLYGKNPPSSPTLLFFFHPVLEVIAIQDNKTENLADYTSSVGFGSKPTELKIIKKGEYDTTNPYR